MMNSTNFANSTKFTVKKKPAHSQRTCHIDEVLINFIVKVTYPSTKKTPWNKRCTTIKHVFHAILQYINMLTFLIESTSTWFSWKMKLNSKNIKLFIANEGDSFPYNDIKVTRNWLHPKWLLSEAAYATGSFCRTRNFFVIPAGVFPKATVQSLIAEKSVLPL